MRSVEVVIPVYNPDKRLYILLKRLLRQKLKPVKIHIMLTLTSEYDELSLLKGLAEEGIRSERISVTTVEKNLFDHGLTRKAGAYETRSDLCLFMTQDAVPYDNMLIMNMAAEFDNNLVAVCYARQMPYKKASVREKFARSFNYPDEPMIKDKAMLDTGSIRTIFCSDVCAMYDMAVFKKLGGFVETDFNEDMLYAYQAVINGYVISYCPGARVFHSHNLSFKEQFKRNKEIARSQNEHFDVFGSLNSENEGMLYVKKGLKYVLKNGNLLDAVKFIADCGFRFLGFKVGKLTTRKCGRKF